MKTKDKVIVLFLILTAVTAFSSCQDPVSSVDPFTIPINLTIVSQPDKLVYELNEEANWSGLTVSTTYIGGRETKRYYSVSDTGISGWGGGFSYRGIDISGFNSSSPGAKTITVTNDGVSATFTVTVNSSAGPGAVLVFLSISSPPDKQVYDLYESSNWTGMKVEETYSDGSTRIETSMSDYSISGFDSWSVGEKTITVTKNEVSTTFTVTIISALNSLSIPSYPDKRVYELNENFDRTGLVVVGNYSDSSSKTETPDEYDIAGFDSTSPGVKTITVSKNGKTVDFTVEVLNRGTGSITILPPSSSAEDITLSQTGADPVTVTASDGYSGYQWFVDDMARPADSGSDGRNITLNTSAYAAGKHRVRVTAYKQGLLYSEEITITLP